MDNIVIPIESNLQNAPLDLGAFVSNAVGVVLLVAALAAFVTSSSAVFSGLLPATTKTDSSSPRTGLPTPSSAWPLWP
jgi:hypothetical protein